MSFIKIVGVIFLCSLAATDMITFKPFIKSRYSLRERRARSSTKAPITKSNDTVLNYSTTEAENQSFSTPVPTQFLETTKAFTEKHQLQESFDQSTAVNAISTTPVTTTTAAAESVTDSVGTIINSSSSVREIINLENEVTEKILVADTTTPKKIETTTQAEWLYDYYDESPKRETSA